MARAVYAVEVSDGAGWHRLFQEGRDHCTGYLQAHEDGPTPRCAMRMVRVREGAVDVVRLVEAVDRPGLGMVAGSPSAATYRRAEAEMRRMAEMAEEREQRAARRRGEGT